MYNPGVQDRSGEFIAQGIRSAGQSVGAGLEKLLSERKQKAKETKVLRQAFKTFMPDRADEFETMGHEELKGQLLGIQMQEKARSEQSRQAEDAAKLDYYKEQRAAVAQRALAEKAQLIALERFKELNGGQLPDGMEGPPRAAANPEQMVANAGAAGFGPEEVGRLASGISHLRGGVAADPKVFKGPNGRDFVVFGNSISPAGIDPKFLKEFGELQGLTDADGNIIAYGAVGPKGDTKIIKPSEARDAQAEAQTRKIDTEELLKRQSELRKIEGAIAYWYESQKANDGKGAQPKSVLTELVKQKMALQHPEAGEAGKVEQKETKGTKVESAKPKVDMGKAEAIRAEFQAGKISKEEALKRLKEIGYGD